MNNHDDDWYIRKGVGLADEWTLTGHQYIESPSGYRSTITAMDEILDSLAAQLVRQVDKVLKDWRCLELFEGHTAVRKFEPLSDTGKDIAASYGKGRTMNTLRAIIDSGVLTNE